MRRCGIEEGGLAIAASLVTACAASSGPTSAPPAAAPTGAKLLVDEFGRTAAYDEECGTVERDDYADDFRHAMFRDGAIGFGKLWLVDGNHLWAMPATAARLDGEIDALVVDAEGELRTAAPKIVVPWIGAANAVAVLTDHVVVAVVDRGVAVLPEGDPARLAWISQSRAIDLGGRGNRLAVAAGRDGVRIWQLDDDGSAASVARPSGFESGYAAGVRWYGVDRPGIAVAACDYIAHYRDGEWRHEGPLAHPNAKDADIGGGRFVYANNGAGVGFGWSPQAISSPDPDYYVNAVAIHESSGMGYAAAGNRAIISFPVFAPVVVARERRDPIGLEVDEDRLFAFGNFRDQGERTLLRYAVAVSGELRTLPDVLEPDGRPTLAPRGWPGSPTMAVHFQGQPVRRYDVTAAVWRAATDVVAIASFGDVTAVVDAAGDLRLYDGGAAPIALAGGIVAPDTAIRVGPDWLMLDDGSGLRLWRRQGASWSPQPLPPSATGLDDLAVLDERVLSGATIEATLGCTFENPAERTNRSRDVRYGWRPMGDGTAVVWCSRAVDPWLPGRRPPEDVGTRVFQCRAGSWGLDACAPLFDLADGPLVDLHPRPGDGWTAILDDRRAWTYAVARLNGAGRELHRRVGLGRPLAWHGTGAGGWLVLADGTAIEIADSVDGWRRGTVHRGPEAAP